MRRWHWSRPLSSAVAMDSTGIPHPGTRTVKPRPTLLSVAAAPLSECVIKELSTWVAHRID